MAITGQGNGLLTNTVITSANDTTAKEEPGSLRYGYDSTNGEKIFKYIKAGSAIANGDALVDSGVTGYTYATTTSAAKRARIRGVGVGTITSGNFGYMQVEGYHSAVKKIATATSSAGIPVTYQSGKIRPYIAAASGKFCAITVSDIIPLSSKGCTCTTVPAMLYLL